ncbi:LVIVD repeat-containing protein [Dyadobacter psychrotolerans]|uniref:LVIVD repeat-containing protein n=1 Tax=Dyadobacter psychrotolerans TaxID=2541721 RepID=A0A4R5E0G3_9BACT|nr:hypothetical protein [Dyadobacter psychrotolerans]TDE17245.1 hypothetical protein E0F88_04945 [Dyadobacter psychrotolerans]
MKKLAPVFFICLALAGVVILLFGCDMKSSDSAISPQSGQGGSMARFAITGNTLYIVSKKSLEVYNISDGASPVKTESKNMEIGIETIFPYQNHLFIGANDGMYIYNNSKPENPVLLTKYSHVQSCDPVVVQGNYAYVTLRASSLCRPGATPSSLDVIDISKPSEPVLVNSQVMDSPYGLGVSNNMLFVCEGEKGFRIMDITNPKLPFGKQYFKDLPSYDVIVRNNQLIITGAKGLFQYQFDDQNNMELLSKIPVL